MTKTNLACKLSNHDRKLELVVPLLNVSDHVVSISTVVMDWHNINLKGNHKRSESFRWTPESLKGLPDSRCIGS